MTGPTDLNFVCSLCLEPVTGCGLCLEAPLIPTPRELATKWREEEEEWRRRHG